MAALERKGRKKMKEAKKCLSWEYVEVMAKMKEIFKYDLLGSPIEDILYEHGFRVVETKKEGNTKTTIYKTSNSHENEWIEYDDYSDCESGVEIERVSCIWYGDVVLFESKEWS